MSNLQQPGIIPSLVVGGRVFTDLSNLIILYANVVTAGRYTTFRKANSSSGYQVTSGKTFTIYAFAMNMNAQSAAGRIQLGYGDTDIGLDSTSAPTTPVWVCGDTNLNLGTCSNGAVGVGLTGPNASQVPGINFGCASQKYPVLYGGSGAITVAVYGYEL